MTRERATLAWQGGLEVHAAIRDLEVTADKPEEKGGGDAGPVLRVAGPASPGKGRAWGFAGIPNSVPTDSRPPPNLPLQAPTERA